MSAEDQYHIGTISGGANSIGGRGNTINMGAYPAQPVQPAQRVPSGTGPTGSPRQALYAFADIVGYSRLNARLQAISQQDLSDLLNIGLTQAGVQPDQLGRMIEASALPVRGLMTMPPLAQDPQASRPWFAALRELADEYGLTELSMGTSQDYPVAVQEGATIVRIGTSLYR